MIQTQHPKEDRELNRNFKLQQKFESLPMNDQVNLVTEFLDGLKIGYHRRFFKSLEPGLLLNERWFLQFLAPKIEGEFK